MARFTGSKRAGTTKVIGPQEHPEPALEAASAFMLRAAQTPLPDPGPEQSQRTATLTEITIRHPDPEVAREAVAQAAQVRCMTEFTRLSTDMRTCAEIARHLAWAAVDGVVDANKALKRGPVDERLAFTADFRPRGHREIRNILYNAGRLLHPTEYPPARVLPAPRTKQKAASYQEIRALYRILWELPSPLGMRALALADLSYGVGARPADFKVLRGTSISTIRAHGRAICVVTLPNVAGGVRQVPVLDQGINCRLLELAARVGDGLVLAPNSEFAERNIVNRISEKLTSKGYPPVRCQPLRNRWILDMAERCIPTALLLQLADVRDVRVLADLRNELPHYKVRHIITIQQESLR
ncbi:hypothetical protein BA059_04920 [Mycolicibacterium sp. (ex Dasyatis americana)]|nr:hypothetical protein BA059_04920 [Mycolicibacterium sp. (ex Dasyatis americana)]